jgi:hypothetical protein
MYLNKAIIIGNLTAISDIAIESNIVKTVAKKARAVFRLNPCDKNILTTKTNIEPAIVTKTGLCPTKIFGAIPKYKTPKENSIATKLEKPRQRATSKTSRPKNTPSQASEGKRYRSITT